MKAKYKLKTKIGDVVRKISINIHSVKNTNTSIYHAEGVFVKCLKIAYQTKYKIALNDDFLTVLDRQKVDEKKQSYQRYLNECTISILTKETYFPNGIFGTIFTTLDEDVAIKKLSQCMQRKIDKEYGWLSYIKVDEFVNKNL